MAAHGVGYGDSRQPVLHHNPRDMTIYTLERAETQQLPAARCTFQQRVSESGKKWVDVTMMHLTSNGWGGTMGRGDGTYTVSQAKEFYGNLLDRGFTAV